MTSQNRTVREILGVPPCLAPEVGSVEEETHGDATDETGDRDGHDPRLHVRITAQSFPR
jgi:hypothetical protein